MIDIIIPVYNTPIGDLKRCFESILRQTFKDYKVILLMMVVIMRLRVF